MFCTIGICLQFLNILLYYNSKNLQKGFVTMKKIQKILSVVLAIVMLLSCMSILGYARDTSYVPTIIIPGLFQSETYHYVNGQVETDSDGNPLVGPFYLSVSKEFIGAALTTALVPIMTMFITQQDKDQLAAKAVAKLAGELLLGKQKSDENGVLDEDVKPERYESSMATATQRQTDKVLSHFPIEGYFDIAGKENLYVFNYVSTGNMIQTANDLYEYIQFVKQDTGSDKVNIVPVSQGGSIANGLFKVYEEKGISLNRDINRIVFAVPALDGATLLGDCYKYGLNKESMALYNTMFPSLLGQEAYLPYLINVLVRLMPKADVDNLLQIVGDTLIYDYLRYSTLLWGLIPSGDYEECADRYLSDLPEIRRQADWYYDAQLNSDAYIAKAKLQGVEIFDIVDTNIELYQLAVSYDSIQADGIIHVDSTSMGAYSVNVNTKLPDDYSQPFNFFCANNFGHNHTDPEGIIDPMAGLLPDQTFFFSGQNHATTASNDVIMSLIIRLLTDESFEDVFDYVNEYPQFNYSRETLQLRKDVAEMREYDRTSLSSADATELDAAIAQVDAMLAVTVVDKDACNAASDRFYAIYDKIVGNNSPLSEKSTSKMLYTVTKGISDGLYDAYGDAAFSEMPMITVGKILG